MNELVALFRQLDDEKMAWDAYRTLDYAQAEYIEQVPNILADNLCDHADDASKYAITANEALARVIIEHHRQIVDRDTPQLLQRRSSRFRAVIAQHHSENPQDNYPDLLEAAIETNDNVLIPALLDGLRSKKTQEKIPVSARERVFQLLLQLCASPTESFLDVPSLVASLNPVRARTELVSEDILKPENPALAEILRNACELNADVPADSLLGIFEQLEGNHLGHVRRSNTVLACVVRLAMRKQNAAFETVLQKASQYSDFDVKRLGLLGLVRLRMPHDPIRSSVEAVDSAPLKSLSNPVKVVAFASKYLDEVDGCEDGILTFARTTSVKRFRHTVKSLGLLKAKQHVALLNWLLEELGENPKASMKGMRRSELSTLTKSVTAKARKFDYDRLRILLYQFILDNSSAFSRTS